MLSEVVGQNRAKEILKRALLNRRLHHSILLYGPEGCGKRALAIQLAMAVNCLNSVDDPCGRCSPCRRIRQFRYPDLKVLFPTMRSMSAEEERSLLDSLAENPYSDLGIARNVNILIDKIRELRSEAAFSPFEARKRVALIFYADQMRAEAANALLKTLEEPPSKMLLVLTTDKPRSLLPTILSRCQKIRLEKLSDEEVASFVAKRYSLEPSKTELISRLCSGNVVSAERMINEDLDLQSESAYKFLSVSLTGKDSELVEMTESMSATRNKVLVERIIQMTAIWLRDIILYRCGQVDEITNLNHMEDIERMARFLDERKTEMMLETLEDLLSMGSRNVNMQLGLMYTMRRLYAIATE